MAHGSAVVGLRLAFHDRLGRSGLPSEWVQHHQPCCLRHKAEQPDRCTPFDTQEVHRAVAGRPEGRIHTCPHGFTEIAVPVMTDGLFAGVLFAGPCWTKRRPRPSADLVVPPNRRWLQQRRSVVGALAWRLGQLLSGEPVHLPDDRRRRILGFLQAGMQRRLTLAELARELHLSASRAGHVVRDLFNMTFPELVRAIKAREAASLLVGTDLPIKRIAPMVGCSDPNYFSYLFRRHYGISPRQYRARYRFRA